MTDAVPVLLVLLTGLLTSAAQLLIKQAAPGIDTDSGLKGLLHSAMNPLLIAGLLLALGAPFIYFFALRRLPLSTAFSLSALSYLWIPLGGVLILKERLSRRQTAAILLIFSGLILWGLPL